MTDRLASGLASAAEEGILAELSERGQALRGAVEGPFTARMIGIDHAEVGDGDDLAISGVPEQRLSVGQPLGLARWVARIFHCAEFGQHQIFVGVCEPEASELFNQCSEVEPWIYDSRSALVPVVGVGCDDIYPGVAGIPFVGGSAVRIGKAERVIGHDPRSPQRLDSLVVEDRHKGTPCVDEVTVCAVCDVVDRLRFMVEREPNLILVRLYLLRPAHHVVVEWVSGLGICDISPEYWLSGARNGPDRQHQIAAIEGGQLGIGREILVPPGERAQEVNLAPDGRLGAGEIGNEASLYGKAEFNLINSLRLGTRRRRAGRKRDKSR